MKIAPSVLALLLFHSSAFAEPAPDDVVVTDDVPKTCGPDLRRAPKSVRRAVQAWLDAQDDLDEAEARADDARAKVATKVAPEGDAPNSPDFAPPGTVEPIDSAPARAKPPSKAWFALDALTGQGQGLRAELDLAVRDHWVFGASTTIASDRLFVSDLALQTSQNQNPLSPVIDTVDGRAMATIARDMGDGPWRLRSSIGAGFVYTSSTATYYYVAGYYGDQPMKVNATGVFPVGEATITAERDLGENWGIEFGILTTLYEQTLHVTPTVVFDREPLQFLLMGGLRHRI